MSSMSRTYLSKDLNAKQLFSVLTSAIIPRPIALVSSIDKDGSVNLSPFSFFNVFSAKPPILIFSVTRRVRDNTTKDTLDNVLIHPEVVIHVMNKEMAEQASLASMDFPKGVNEFEKAGFKSVPADLVKPPRIPTAPIAFECTINQVIALGEEGGAGNLVFCEVLKMHINESLLESDFMIDPIALDAVARAGGAWYQATNNKTMFQLPKPVARIGIGIDGLPPKLSSSKILSGSDLARLAGIPELPCDMNLGENWSAQKLNEVHNHVKSLIEDKSVEDAWAYLTMESERGIRT